MCAPIVSDRLTCKVRFLFLWLMLILLGFSTPSAFAQVEFYSQDRVWLMLNDSFWQTAIKEKDGSIRYPTGDAVLDRVMQQVSANRLEPMFTHDPISLKNPTFYENRLHLHYKILWNYPQQKFDPYQLVSQLKSSAAVNETDVIYLKHTTLTPNDWGLSGRNMWFLDSIKARSAWDNQQGNSSILAVTIDTGVEYNHEDLYPNIRTNPLEDVNGDGRFTSADNNGNDADGNGFVDDVIGWDFVSHSYTEIPGASAATGEDYGPRDNTPYDVHGHGTHVMGSIAARTNNSIGVPAASFNVQTLAIRAGFAYIYSGQLRGSGYDDDFIAAIQYAVNRGARIISISFGGGGSSSAYQDAVNYARSNNCLVFAAAGNDNSSTVSYPAGYNGVLAIAALTTGNVKASFSNYGSWVDLSAPGTSIWSTMVVNTYNPNPYVAWDGTSMATPTAASVGALVLSGNPSLTDDQLETILLTTATSVNAQNPSYVNQLGSGIVNAQAAVATLRPVNVVYPNGGETLTINSGVTIQWTYQPSVTNVRIELNRNYPSGTWETIVASTPSNGSYSWNVTAPTTTNARIRIVNTANSSQADTSNANFSIINAPTSLAEFFEGTFPNTGWSNLGRWEQYLYSSNRSVRLNYYSLSDLGSTDTLLAPILNLAGQTGLQLRFSTSYVNYSSYNDSLFVLARIGNGAWTSLWRQGGAQLTNRPSGREPTAWRSNQIVIPSQFFVSGVQFAFVGYNGYGDNLYLDSVQTIFTPSTITVQTPNGGENWGIGTTQNITWTSTNITGNVAIELNRNFPSSNWETLYSSTANDGVEPWNVTGPITTTARIRIRTVSMSPEISDTSNASFSILNLPTTLAEYFEGTFPNTGWNNLGRWAQYLYNNNRSARLNYYSLTNIGSTDTLLTPVLNLFNQSSLQLIFSTSYVNYSSYNDSLFVLARVGNGAWTSLWRQGGAQLTNRPSGREPTAWRRNQFNIPSQFLVSGVQFAFVGYNGYGDNLYLDSVLTAQTIPEITVLSPNGGEIWPINTNQTITWSSQNIVGNVAIDLNRNYPTGTWETIIPNTANDGSETWNVTEPITAFARIRVRTIAMSPEVSDLSNNHFTITTAPQIFNSTSVPVAINDNSTAYAYINIPNNLIITDVNCLININHTFVGDLEIRLISPQNTNVLLVDNRGGSGDNFTQTLFDDEASTPITSGSPPFTGSFRPEGLLSSFDGQNAQGQWALMVMDQATADVGTITQFTLQIVGVTTVSGTVTASVGGAPIDSVYITLGIFQTYSDVNGFYTLNVPAGQFTINATKLGWVPYSAPINATSSIVHNITLSSPFANVEPPTATTTIEVPDTAVFTVVLTNIGDAVMNWTAELFPSQGPGHTEVRYFPTENHGTLAKVLGPVGSIGAVTASATELHSYQLPLSQSPTDEIDTGSWDYTPASGTLPPAGQQVFTIRYIPQLGDPTSTQTANFKINWRADNQFTIVPLTVNVNATQQPGTIVFPNGGETVLISIPTNIQWTPNPNVTHVSIELNRNYPSGPWETIALEVANNGTYPWSPTPPEVNTARIRITDVNNPYRTVVSAGNFTIDTPEITSILRPNGGERFYIGVPDTIRWTANYMGLPVRIDLNRNYPGGAWTTLVSSAPNTGSYRWTPTGPGTTNARVRVRYASGVGIQKIADGNFTILQAQLNLTTHNTVDTLYVGDWDTLRWNFTEITGNVRLFANWNYPNGIWEEIGTGIPITQGQFPYLVSTAGQARFVVQSVLYPMIRDTTDATTVILPPRFLQIVTPNGGEVVYRNQPMTISWNANYHSTISLGFSPAGQQVDSLILIPGADNLPSTVGMNHFVWIPNRTTPNGMIYIVDHFRPIEDWSDAPFEVTDPILTVQYPNGGENLYVGVPVAVQVYSSIPMNIHLGFSAAGPNVDSVAYIYQNYSIGAGTTTLNWTPSRPTTQGRIYITSPQYGVFDWSNGNFNVIQNTIQVLRPNGGETFVVNRPDTIRWIANFTGLVQIQLARYGLSNPSRELITNSAVAQQGYFVWNPTGPASNNCYIIITDPLTAVSDQSDNSFNIVTSSLTLLKPVGGEVFLIGVPDTIRWSAANVMGNASISIQRIPFATWISLGSVNATLSNEFLWVPTGPPTNTARVRVSSLETQAVADSSPAFFSIQYFQWGTSPFRIKNTNTNPQASWQPPIPYDPQTNGLPPLSIVFPSQTGTRTNPDSVTVSYRPFGPADDEVLPSETINRIWTITPSSQNFQGATLTLRFTSSDLPSTIPDPINANPSLGGIMSEDGGTTWIFVPGGSVDNDTAANTYKMTIHNVNQFSDWAITNHGIRPRFSTYNTSDTLYLGDTATFRWSRDILGGSVTIQINRNYPLGTWETILSNTDNDSIENWVVSGSEAVNVRFRIYSNWFNADGDTTDANVVIMYKVPKAPNNFVVVRNGSSMNLTWSKVDSSVYGERMNIDGYKLYYMDIFSYSGIWTLLTTITDAADTTHTDVNILNTNTTRYYMIKAYVGGTTSSSSYPIYIRRREE
ncbi:MAG: S8 family serine peptidase [bacterium]|nr:S8 family serine peptidase [bacterium]